MLPVCANLSPNRPVIRWMSVYVNPSLKRPVIRWMSAKLLSWMWAGMSGSPQLLMCSLAR